MQLDEQMVASALDGLAEDMSTRLGQEQAFGDQGMLKQLEDLRKKLATAAPDLIGAYYGYLQVKERYDQLLVRVAWTKQRFWRLFLLQAGALVILLVLALGYEWGQWRHVWLSVPLAAEEVMAWIWWGSVGATLSALHALYEHRLRGTLSDSLDAWLAAKPLSGGVLGLLSGLALQVTAYGATGDWHTQGVLSYLFAFIAGFSERRFLTYLQKRVSQLTQGTDQKSG